MTTLRIPLRVGETLSATVRRKLTTNRVLICLKGHTLVAEPDYNVEPGVDIKVQVLTIVPRIRLRVLKPDGLSDNGRSAFPHGLRT